MRRRVAAAALRRVGGIDRSLVARGLDVAGQVGASAAEVVRVRRDPAAAALRRRTAARRRVQVWSAAAVGGIALGSVGVIELITTAIAFGAVASGLFGLLILIWAGTGLTRSVRDLRMRSRAVAALPPPQPGRASVDPVIRPLMSRLSEHSDSLRALTELIGVADGTAMHDLRRDILSEADRAEVHLRGRARTYSTMARTRRTAPPDAVRRLDSVSGELLGQLENGVAEYGRLVAAALDAVEATRSLQTRLDGLTDVDERLRGLAAGMRELADL